MAKKKKINYIDGVDGDQTLTGTDNIDVIKTKSGNDIIVGGKGDDVILIDGEGNKTIQINPGDGNDTIYTTGKSTNYAINVELSNPTKYKRDGLDFIISNGSESVRLKDYSNLISALTALLGSKDDYKNFQLNGQTLKEINAINPIQTEIKVTKGSSFINQLADLTGGGEGLITDLKKAKIKIPKWIKNINLLYGTPFNDVITGSNKKGIDIIISEGGDSNNLTTGKKAKTAVISLSENTDDTYTVSDFAAGTIIMDGGSKTKNIITYEGETGDKLIIKNVDINDIHMATASNLNKLTEEGQQMADLATNYSASAIYLTDSKGIKNFAGINYSGIYKNLKDKITEFKNNPTSESIASIVKYAIKTVPSIIDKFRGIMVSVGENMKDENDDGNPIPYGTMFDKSVTVFDKKGNEQSISLGAIRAYDKYSDESINNYVQGIITKYGLNKYTDENSILVKAANDEDKNIARFIQYMLDGVDTTGLSKKQKKNAIAEYNSVKARFFNTFKNLFIGTTGDNSYTITKANAGGAYVSDAGNDTFTFKGALANKNSTAKYKIVSNLDTVDPNIGIPQAGADLKDTIVFKNYSFDDYSLLFDETKFVYDIGASEEFAINFKASDYKNRAYSDIEYVYDYRDVLAGFSGLTFSFGDDAIRIKDSTKTEYSVSVHTNNVAATHNGEITTDWTNPAETNSKGKKYSELNNFAIYNTDSLNIKSNNKKNVIIFNSRADGVERSIGDLGYNEIPERASLNYTYGGGSDIVYSSNWYSDDTYNVTFNDKTKLLINDTGENDFDKIKFADPDTGNMRLFFNVGKDASVQGNINIVSKGNMKKSNFILALADGVKNIFANKGVSFKYDLAPDENNRGEGIEAVRTEGSQEFILAGEDGAINTIAQNVALWLDNHTKYLDAYDVLAKGSKKDISSLLKIYSNVELQTKDLNL